MDRRLRSKAGQAVHALGKTIVEPVVGAKSEDPERWIVSEDAAWRR